MPEAPAPVPAAPAAAPADNAAAPAPTPAAAPPPLIRKIKVEGQEVELDEDSLLLHAQRGYAADRRFQDAARMRKEAEESRAQLAREKAEVMERLKADAWTALREAGLTDEQIDHLAARRVMGRAEQAGMSPEAQRARQLEQELEQLRGQAATAKKQQEEAAAKAEKEAVDRATEAQLQQFAKLFRAGLEKAGIDANHRHALPALAEMGALTRSAVLMLAEGVIDQEGYQRAIDPDRLAKEAATRVEAADLRTLTSIKDDAALVQRMGMGLANRVVRGMLALRQAGTNGQKPATAQAPAAAAQPRGADGKFQAPQPVRPSDFDLFMGGAAKTGA